ncbi:MAG: Glu/Leu/Phe/Val dehydrogenase [Bdellovibrionales bacterium]|nr:Glu/Leu/Phe/Val dehydrogenase [Bdellovibrionales bacterium]
MVFENIHKYGNHEQIIYCHDHQTGLRGIIAIHDTTLGPALGGTRMWNYATEEEALIDVLRLSEGMTYKAAAAGLNLGGGKAVIIGDYKKDKSEGLFRAFGQYINTLNGRYITAEDVGTSVKDMEQVYMETPWVTGIPKGLGGSGDPSPYTAHGVLMGIKAACKEKLGTDDLKGVRVAVQGLGNVGSNLVKYLTEEGAQVTIADIEQERVAQIAETYNCEAVAPDQILEVECDVLAPCALGGVINDQSIPKLKCKIVAGGANNQLAETRHGDALREVGILYAPDFVANAGGLMNVFAELEGYSVERALERTTSVFDNMMHIFAEAKDQNISTVDAAYNHAKKRLETLGRLKRKHLGFTSRPFTTLKEVKNR